MSKFSFDPHTTRFSLTNAFALAEACEKVYFSKTDCLEFLKNKWNFEKKEYFSELSTQVFICGNDEVILLVFKGTKEPEDWQVNKDIKLIDGPVGRVHRGFWKALESVWEDIEKTFKSFYDNSQSIWVSGHSLGGALAMLAVSRLIDLEYEVNGLYTFGQPRVGDQDFADYLDAQMRTRIFRFVNDEDIVTRVPPRFLGFAEAGTVRYINRKGILQDDNVSWKRWLDRSESVAARSSLERYDELKAQYPDGIDDHGMGHYIRYIKKNLNAITPPKDFRDYLRRI